MPNPAPALIGAVEAGGTKFVLALAREDGEVLESARIPTERPEATFAAMTAFFHAASARHGPLSAFGIASFGPIDVDPASPANGTILKTTKPGWEGASYRAALREFGLPIGIDTDVNGAALGEWSMGAGQGCATLAYTTVGTGVGTGVVRAGRPLMGFSHYEAGHIGIARDPARDPFEGICPFHGDCLEGLAAGPAIARRWNLERGQPLSDPAGIALVADYLAQLAVNLVLLHMPDRLVFGGGVMKTPGLIEALRQAAERRLGGYLHTDRIDPGMTRYIVTPGLGDNAGITGAIALGRAALRA